MVKTLIKVSKKGKMLNQYKYRSCESVLDGLNQYASIIKKVTDGQLDIKVFAFGGCGKEKYKEDQMFNLLVNEEPFELLLSEKEAKHDMDLLLSGFNVANTGSVTL